MSARERVRMVACYVVLAVIAVMAITPGAVFSMLR